VRVSSINEKAIGEQWDVRGHRELQDDIRRIEITNARPTSITFEARLDLPHDIQVIRSTVAPVLRDGRWVMRITVPAGSQTMIHYQTEHRAQAR
jgi:hypothetical protein